MYQIMILLLHGHIVAAAQHVHIRLRRRSSYLVMRCQFQEHQQFAYPPVDSLPSMDLSVHCSSVALRASCCADAAPDCFRHRQA